MNDRAFILREDKAEEFLSKGKQNKRTDNKNEDNISILDRMSNEDAKEILEEIKNKICGHKYVTAQSEAFDIAIELLEGKSSCENCPVKQELDRLKKEHNNYVN